MRLIDLRLFNSKKVFYFIKDELIENVADVWCLYG